MVGPSRVIEVDIWLICCQSTKVASLGQGLPSTRASSQPRPREASGGAFTQFSPEQVKQFKEAFNMVDQDGDGRVTESDLRKMLEELGKFPRVKHKADVNSALNLRLPQARRPAQR